MKIDIESVTFITCIASLHTCSEVLDEPGLRAMAVEAIKDMEAAASAYYAAKFKEAGKDAAPML